MTRWIRVVALVVLLIGRCIAMNYGSSNRCQYLFTGISESGEMFAWGHEKYFWGFIQQQIQNVKTMVSTETAYLIMLWDGTVQAHGLPGSGVPLPADASSTINLHGVTQMAASKNAFAVLLNDGLGTVRAWGGAAGGSPNAATKSKLTGVKFLRANNAGFVAVREDGTAVVWGEEEYPESAQRNLTSIKEVYVSNEAFVAVKTNGRVVSVGPVSDYDIPPDKAPLLVDVERVYTNHKAIAALTKNGSVITWGCCSNNHFSTCKIQASNGKWNGIYDTREKCELSVYGAYMTEEEQVAVSSGVYTISSTVSAFAAVKLDGSVFAWGNDMYGGDVPSNIAEYLSNVNTVFATFAAFAALREDSSLIVWGFGIMGGQVPDLMLGSSPFLTNIVAVESSMNGFSAMTKDGRILAWEGQVDFLGAKLGIIETSDLFNVSAMAATSMAFGYIRNGSARDPPTLDAAARGIDINGGVMNAESVARIKDVGTPAMLVGSTIYYADSTVGAALPCPAGKYGLKGWPECETCPTPDPAYVVKRYVSGVRTTIGSCIDCPEGKFSTDGATEDIRGTLRNAPPLGPQKRICRWDS